MPKQTRRCSAQVNGRHLMASGPPWPCSTSSSPATRPRPVDEPVMKTRAMSVQALPVSTLICTLLYRRAPSTPIVSEARGGASYFFPLACARERSAGRRSGNKLTPRERRRVLLRSSTHASGAPLRRFFTRPPHFLAWTGGIDLHVIRAAFAPPFIQTRAAI